MRTKLFSILPVLLICLHAPIHVISIDFTGTWILNASKSDFNKSPNESAPADLVKIAQYKDSLILSRTFSNEVSVDHYHFDGTILEVLLYNPKANTQKKSSIQWSDDKTKFSIISDYTITPTGEDSSWQYKRTEVYSLTDEGKTLQIDRVTVYPDRKETTKVVYDKQ